MKSIVVDASVAAKWYFPEVQSTAALRLFSPRRRILAPDFIRPEVVNVVWKRVRRQELSTDEGKSIVEAFLRTPLETVSAVSLLFDAFELAAATGRTVYDCLYLALAIGKECILVTADRRFFRAVSGTSFARYVRFLGETKRSK